MLFAAVSDSFNIISQVLKFVKHFFQNFLIYFIAVFRFPTNSHSVSFQQLYYSIIKFLVCQVLFLKFFQLLSFTRLPSLLRVLSYYITSPPLCQFRILHKIFATKLMLYGKNEQGAAYYIMQLQTINYFIRLKTVFVPPLRSVCLSG